eukprot:1079573-Pelagomonas_calceolata.AAC.15
MKRWIEAYESSPSAITNAHAAQRATACNTEGYLHGPACYDTLCSAALEIRHQICCPAPGELWHLASRQNEVSPFTNSLASSSNICMRQAWDLPKAVNEALPGRRPLFAPEATAHRRAPAARCA